MTTTSIDTQTTIRVPLAGTHGAGKYLTADAADAETIAKFGPWTLIPNGTGREYVRVNRSALRASTSQPSGAALASLSRILLGAKRGQHVVFRDGDTLNHTRENLLAMSQAEAAQWRRDHGIA